MSIQTKYKDLVTIGCVIIGSLLCAVNINTFISAGGLFPGGFTGLTVLIQRSFEKYAGISVSYSLVNFTLNAIPAYIGYKTVGKKFTFYSCVMIILTGVFVEILPTTNITEDILLITIFGGILQGVALGIALRGNASSGGTDFIAMWISQKTHQPAWNYILGMNAVMLIVAGYLFGWDKALYSIIFQFASTQMIHMLHTAYKKETLFIVTDRPDDVYKEIYEVTNHSATEFAATGCYSNKQRKMLYSVVSSSEAKVLVSRVQKADPEAFINVIKTDFLEGHFYQKVDY